MQIFDRETSGAKTLDYAYGPMADKKDLGLQQSMICLLIQGHFLWQSSSSFTAASTVLWRKSYTWCTILSINYEVLPSNMSQTAPAS